VLSCSKLGQATEECVDPDLAKKRKLSANDLITYGSELTLSVVIEVRLNEVDAGLKHLVSLRREVSPMFERIKIQLRVDVKNERRTTTNVESHTLQAPYIFL
jgi:hypothetical protein